MTERESIISKHHSVYREPAGFQKFVTKGSSPLSDAVVEAAFEDYIAGTKVDIVGMDSIANLQTISKYLLQKGGGVVRIFEPQKRYCDALVYYQKENSQQNIDVQIYMEKYEDAAIKLSGTPAITFVDKTMLHATQPIKLLNALTFGGPDRKIVLSGYGEYPAFQHRMTRGKSVAHTGHNKYHDGSVVYGGSCAPIYAILKENTDYLFHKKFTVNEGVVVDAMPRRVNGVVYERRPINSLQTAVENAETIFDKGMWVRKRPSKNWVDIPPGIYNSLLSGLSELWISEDGQLSAEKLGQNDKKLMIGVYDLVEVVVWSNDIDTESFRKNLPRKFYSSIK